MRFMPILIAILLITHPCPAFTQTRLSDDALRQCAQARVPECQFAYGQKLQIGEGVTPDPVEAKRLYESAYAAGFQPAGEALLKLLRTEDRSSTAATPTPTPAQDANTGSIPTSTAPTAAPSLIKCAESSDKASCHLSVSGTAVNLSGKRLTILLRIQNPTAAKVYVSRGLLRAHQASSSLTVLDASQSTAWGRFAEAGTSALGFLPEMAEMAPTKPSLSSSAISRNLGVTAGQKAVESIGPPSGRVDYLRSGYVEPGAEMHAIVMVKILDATTPVSIQMELGEEKVGFNVPLIN